MNPIQNPENNSAHTHGKQDQGRAEMHLPCRHEARATVSRASRAWAQLKQMAA
jgi:hypothetical protein